MQDIFEKIKERLEKEHKLAEEDAERYDKGNSNHFKYAKARGYVNAMEVAIEIVNQVAEEFGSDINVRSSNSEIQNKLLDSLHRKILKSKVAEEVTEAEIEVLVKAKELTDDGWIPCSERLPEVFEDTKSSDVVLVCGYDEESDYSWQAMGFYVHTEAIKRWFFAECKDTDKPIDWIDIVAWQPLPAPYKPKGEK